MSLRTARSATPESIQRLAKTNLEKALRIKTLEAYINGLMDAMKPLLDEWQKLKKEVVNEKEN
jgi:hypothetical protein